jgi:hypothetical protein
MKRVYVGVCLGLAVLGVGVAAKAGWRWNNYSVTVDTTNRTASGQVGGVRDNSDNVSYIGCTVEGWIDLDGKKKLTCQAKDSAGRTASCYVFSWKNTGLAAVDIAQAMNGDSYLSFSWDSKGLCQYVAVENYSWHAPKVL